MPPVCSRVMGEGEEVFSRVSEELGCSRVDPFQNADPFCVLGENVFGIRLAEIRCIELTQKAIDYLNRYRTIRS